MLDLDHALATAERAARAAADVLRHHDRHRDALVIDTKMRNDLVSQADREAEAALLAVLRAETPALGIVAEESGGAPSGVASWYVDPLDGTTNFLHGLPHYAVSVGLIAPAGTVIDGQPTLAHDAPVVAVVYDVMRDECFSARLGGGASCNGRALRTSAAAQLSESLLATGLPFRDFSFEDQYQPMLHDAIHQTRGVRRFGSAALDLAWVACGRFDGYWELGLAPWDVAAGTLLVREAGGVAGDLRALPAWPLSGNVLASAPALAPALHAMLAAHLKPEAGSNQA